MLVLVAVEMLEMVDKVELVEQVEIGVRMVQQEELVPLEQTETMVVELLGLLEPLEEPQEERLLVLDIRLIPQTV